MGYRSEVMAAFYADKSKGAALKLFVDENFPEELAGNLRPIKNGRYQGLSVSRGREREVVRQLPRDH